MSIFLSISSYRDPLLTNTLISAYENAANKENLIFAVVDQNNKKLNTNQFNFAQQIRYLFLDYTYARGPSWARSLAQSLYMGEKYFFQVDSHTIFEPGWDEYFIKYYEKLSKKFYKPIISSYPRNFEIDDLENNTFRKYQYDDTSTHVMVIDENNVFKDGCFSMKKGIPSGDNQIKKGFLISAGCLFSSGEIVNEVPYDPYLYFDGEEDSIAWRLYTNGYSIFHTPNTPLFHYYINPNNVIKRPFHWDESENIDRQTNWIDLRTNGRERLQKIVDQRLPSPFGLGKVKTLNDYAKFSGLDIEKMKVLEPENVFKFNRLNEVKWSHDSEKFSIL